MINYVRTEEQTWSNHRPETAFTRQPGTGITPGQNGCTWLVGIRTPRPSLRVRSSRSPRMGCSGHGLRRCALAVRSRPLVSHTSRGRIGQRRVARPGDFPGVTGHGLGTWPRPVSEQAEDRSKRRVDVAEFMRIDAAGEVAETVAVDGCELVENQAGLGPVHLDF